MFDSYDIDEKCLLCLYDNGKLYYIIVQRDPELKYTGKSVITRIMENKHRFIGDFYSTQSHFMIKYIDDQHIKFDDMYTGADRNEMTLKELDSYLCDDTYKYIYVYDVSKNSLLIKVPDEEIIYLDFYNREFVEDFLQNI